MTALVLVDTNVFVYAHDASEPDKRARAREWLDLLWREQRGRTSTQILSEYFSVVTRKTRLGVSPEDAWEDVRTFWSWRPQELDSELLRRAYELTRRYRLNWWDCLVIAAAQAQSCSLVLTEDLEDGANYGGVFVRNPIVLGVAEEHTAYVSPAKIAARYRGRGRPRRNPARTAAGS